MPKVIMVDHIQLTIEDENEFENLCERFKNNVQIDDIDEWKKKNKIKCLIYKPETYVNHVNYYLNQDPPDLKFASEELWGLAVHVIKKYFLNMGLAIRSHQATKTLSLFLFGFHKNSNVTTTLTDYFWNVELCHRNFYTAFFMEDDLKLILTKTQKFIDNVTDIFEVNVTKVLMEHTDEINPNQFLKFVKFSKTLTSETIEGKEYAVKYIAT